MDAIGGAKVVGRGLDDAHPRIDLWLARFALVIAAGLLIWLPLQTPFVAILYQYSQWTVEWARALVLAKDVIGAAATGLLVVALWRRVHWTVFDFAGFGYVALVVLYAVVPYLVGQALPTMAVVASVRNFVLPVELFVLGRLVVGAGVRLGVLAAVFLAVSAASASFTVAQYFLTPPSFWVSTIDLVGYVREVQGIPSARDLWSISALGHFGVGEVATFPRAVGTFAHPVGAGHYFVLAVSLAVASLLAGGPLRGWRALALVILFAAVVIVPISRGAWIAAVVAVGILGMLTRRVRLTALGLAAAIAFVTVVPPYSYSVSSGLSLTDTSIRGHIEAVAHGVRVVLTNPLGLGAGHADQPGTVYSQPSASPDQGSGGQPGSGGETPASSAGTTSEGVGESMYLSIWVTAGPIGLVLFLTWIVGTLARLGLGSGNDWKRLAVLAAFAGLLVASAFASPLMRFTSGGSVWLLLGAALVPDVDLQQVPRRIWLLHRRAPSRARER
jgi:hypothetical protein